MLFGLFHNSNCMLFGLFHISWLLLLFFSLSCEWRDKERCQKTTKASVYCLGCITLHLIHQGISSLLLSEVSWVRRRAYFWVTNNWMAQSAKELSQNFVVMVVEAQTSSEHWPETRLTVLVNLYLYLKCLFKIILNSWT